MGNRFSFLEDTISCAEDLSMAVSRMADTVRDILVPAEARSTVYQFLKRPDVSKLIKQKKVESIRNDLQKLNDTKAISDYMENLSKLLPKEGADLTMAEIEKLAGELGINMDEPVAEGDSKVPVGTRVQINKSPMSGVTGVVVGGNPHQIVVRADRTSGSVRKGSSFTLRPHEVNPISGGGENIKEGDFVKVFNEHFDGVDGVAREISPLKIEVEVKIPWEGLISGMPTRISRGDVLSVPASDVWGSQNEMDETSEKDVDGYYQRDVDTEMIGDSSALPGLRVEIEKGSDKVKITALDWQDDSYDHSPDEKSGFQKAEYTVDLVKFFDPKADHRGNDISDKKWSASEVAEMQADQREKAILAIADAYIQTEGPDKRMRASSGDASDFGITDPYDENSSTVGFGPPVEEDIEQGDFVVGRDPRYKKMTGKVIKADSKVLIVKLSQPFHSKDYSFPKGDTVFIPREYVSLAHDPGTVIPPGEIAESVWEDDGHFMRWAKREMLQTEDAQCIDQINLMARAYVENYVGDRPEHVIKAMLWGLRHSQLSEKAACHQTSEIDMTEPGMTKEVVEGGSSDVASLLGFIVKKHGYESYLDGITGKSWKYDKKPSVLAANELQLQFAGDKGAGDNAKPAFLLSVEHDDPKNLYSLTLSYRDGDGNEHKGRTQMGIKADQLADPKVALGNAAELIPVPAEVVVSEKKAAENPEPFVKEEDSNPVVNDPLFAKLTSREQNFLQNFLGSITGKKADDGMNFSMDISSYGYKNKGPLQQLFNKYYAEAKVAAGVEEGEKVLSEEIMEDAMRLKTRMVDFAKKKNQNYEDVESPRFLESVEAAIHLWMEELEDNDLAEAILKMSSHRDYSLVDNALAESIKDGLKAEFEESFDISSDIYDEIRNALNDSILRAANEKAAESYSTPDDQIKEKYGEEVWVRASFGDAEAVNGDLTLDGNGNRVRHSSGKDRRNPPADYRYTNEGGAVPTVEEEVSLDTAVDDAADQTLIKDKKIIWRVAKKEELGEPGDMVYSRVSGETEVYAMNAEPISERGDADEDLGKPIKSDDPEGAELSSPMADQFAVLPPPEEVTEDAQRKTAKVRLASDRSYHRLSQREQGFISSFLESVTGSPNVDGAQFQYALTTNDFQSIGGLLCVFNEHYPAFAEGLETEAVRMPVVQKSELNKINKEITALTTNKFFDDMWEPTKAISEIIEKHSLGLEDYTIHGEPKGRLTLNLLMNGEGTRNALSLSWYKMETGRYEVVAYVS